MLDCVAASVAELDVVCCCYIQFLGLSPSRDYLVLGYVAVHWQLLYVCTGKRCNVLRPNRQAHKSWVRYLRRCFRTYNFFSKSKCFTFINSVTSTATSAAIWLCFGGFRHRFQGFSLFICMKVLAHPGGMIIRLKNVCAPCRAALFVGSGALAFVY